MLNFCWRTPSRVCRHNHWNSMSVALRDDAAADIMMINSLWKRRWWRSAKSREKQTENHRYNFYDTQKTSPSILLTGLLAYGTDVRNMAAGGLRTGSCNWNWTNNKSLLAFSRKLNYSLTDTGNEWKILSSTQSCPVGCWLHLL